MKKITVYYAGQVHREYLNVSTLLRGIPFEAISRELCNESLELYNGCYIHLQGFYGQWDGWYRADQTPVLEADVPKELRLLVLITN